MGTYKCVNQLVFDDQGMLVFHCWTIKLYSVQYKHADTLMHSQQHEACSHAMWLLLMQPEIQVLDVNQIFICNNIAMLKVGTLLTMWLLLAK